MKSNKSNVTDSGITGLIQQFIENASNIYIFLMLGIFPLYFQDNYINIAEAKISFFKSVSIVYFVAILFFQMVRLKTENNVFDIQNIKKSITLKSLKSRFSLTDLCCVIFGLGIFFSWLVTDYRAAAWSGVEGRRLGILMLVFCIAVYFFVSRCLSFPQMILWVLLGTNVLVSTLAILNYLSIDPLGMYSNLIAEQHSAFISTLGNVNIFSSYQCIFLPLISCLYLLSNMKISRMIYGVYLVLGFMGALVSNSDSIFIGLGMTFLFMGYFALENKNRLKNYLELWIMFFCSGVLVGFIDKFMNKGTKVLLGTQSIFTKNALYGVVILGMLYLFLLLCDKNLPDILEGINRFKKAYFAFAILFILGILGLIIFMNTTSNPEKYGYLATLLHFNDSWGSSRGMIWRVSIASYEKEGLLNKIFGFGVDCYKMLVYQFHGTELQARFSKPLVDAHNEFLQYLICIGIPGVVGYFGMLISSVKQYLKYVGDSPILLAFATAVVGYFGQGLVNNPQVFSTPLVFLVLGIGESIYRNQKYLTRIQ